MGSFVLPGEALSVPFGRALVAVLLEREGFGESPDVLLVVTELLTNALGHSRSGLPGGRVSLAVADCGGRVVRVEVTDEGSEASIPRVREVPGGDQVPGDGDGVPAAGGLGLLLVERIARGWGWQDKAPERMVWCEVAL